MLLGSLFVVSEGIFFAMVLESLKSAVPVISHGIAVVRNFRFLDFVQQNVEESFLGPFLFLMFRIPFFLFQPGHTDNHLNRVHFEIVLNAKSVCSVNPSLDVYFNSDFCIIYIGRSTEIFY